MLANTEGIQPSITFLNMTGDITITWDKSNQQRMLELIKQKMQEGFSFFILKPRFLGLFGRKKVKANSLVELLAAGSAVVSDEDYAAMMGKLKLHDAAVESAVASGSAKLIRPVEPMDNTSIRRAKTPEEVLQHQTMAIRPVRGG